MDKPKGDDHPLRHMAGLSWQQFTYESTKLLAEQAALHQFIKLLITVTDWKFQMGISFYRILAGKPITNLS
jgi:hypothetical protein